MAKKYSSNDIIMTWFSVSFEPPSFVEDFLHWSS